MGKKKPQVEVSEYFASMHQGICIGPVDAIQRIIIKEKIAWEGSEATQTKFAIHKDDLFGDVKKEGGVRGVVHYLPGADDQILYDELAVKLGRANGADCPGYRGIASVFFTGSLGIVGSPLSEPTPRKGFLWGANSPYLPGIWITVLRAPVGLNPLYALVPRSDEAPTFPSQYQSTNTLWNISWSPDATRFLTDTNGGFHLYDAVTRTVVTTGGSGPYGHAAVMESNVYGSVVDVPYVWAADVTGGVPLSNPMGHNTGECWRVGDTPVWGEFANHSTVFVGTGFTEVTLASDYDWLFADLDGNGWAMWHNATDIELHCIFGARLGETATIPTTLSGTAFGICNPAGELAAFRDDGAVRINLADFSVVATASLTGITPDFNDFGPYDVSTAFVWLRNSVAGTVNKVSTTTLAILRTETLSDWGTTGSSRLAYDPVNEAFLYDEGGPYGTGGFFWLFMAAGPPLDANPAHIIYECLTNTDWGMGSPSTAIDVASFEAAGIVLYDDLFGLSMIWTRQASIQDFIQEVLDHIQAVLFVDPSTGLLTLKLIRGDYDPLTLPEINPDNANLENFGRKLWGEIVNEIVVTWTNPDNEQEETVILQDLASIVIQGGIVSDGRNYYGVRYAALAARLATRDLRSSGSPLAACECEVDRTLWQARPASVFSMVWPEYGLNGVVMRVTSVDYGKPGDPTIKLQLMEDVYGLDVGAYEEPPSSGWVDPSTEPEPLEIEQVFTMPLFMAANSQVAAFVDDPVYPEVVAGVLGTTSDEDTYAFELWNEVTLSNGDLEWQAIGTENVLGHAELVDPLVAEASSAGVTFDNLIGQTGPVLSGFAIIGDEGEEGNEIALIEAVGASYTLARGVLDTVPRAWPAATPVWFVDESTSFEDSGIRSSGETVEYKFLSQTSLGRLALSSASVVSYELTDRPWLPNRPADVTAYGEDFNTAASPVDATARPDPWVTVAWAHRNRLQEDSQVLAWTDATMTPETGQTTTITVLLTDGVTVLASHTGLTGTTFDVPDASFGGAVTVIIRVSSSRTDADGTFESLQSHDIFVQVGSSRATEASDTRLTEAGDQRGLEG